MFEIGDVQTLSFEITYEKSSPAAWREGLKSIERGRFLSGNVVSEAVVDKDEPALMLLGAEFGILVFHDRILMIANPLVELLRIPAPRQTPLSKDALQNMSTDFNMVVGIVLGTLGINIDATAFKIEIELKKSKTAYADRSVGKAIGGSIGELLGESAKVESASAKFVTNEAFLEKPATAIYDLDGELSLGERQCNVAFSGQMRFANTGPQDLEGVTVKYVDRINEVIGRLAKGMKPVE